MISGGVAVKEMMPGAGEIRRTALMAERVESAPLPVMVMTPFTTGTYRRVTLLAPSLNVPEKFSLSWMVFTMPLTV